jgi:hypothetical protein
MNQRTDHRSTDPRHSGAATMPRRRMLAVAAVLAAVAGAAAVPQPTARTTPLKLAGASLAPSTQITAHDGAFWNGSTKIVLRGFNQEVAVTDAELSQMATWGFNAQMLHVHWNELEPNAPVKNPDGTWTHTYDPSYVTKIKTMVQQAQRYHLYVMMKNTWCSGDGCPYFAYPAWLYQSPYNSHGVTYAETADGLNQSATDFWTDPLRQQFEADMWSYLAGALKSTPNIVGYEIHNEPNAGSLPNNAATTQTVLDWQLSVAQVIRAADPARVVFFATHAGYGPGISRADLSGWQTLGNVAFDLHDYFGARWGDGLYEQASSQTNQEGLQVMYLGRTADFAPPYFGTTLSQQRFLGQAQTALANVGIPLLVGELGDNGPTDPGAYAYFGTVTSALKNLGLSWCAFYGGNLGITDGTNLYPWGQIVVDAAKG